MGQEARKPDYFSATFRVALLVVGLAVVVLMLIPPPSDPVTSRLNAHQGMTVFGGGKATIRARGFTDVDRADIPTGTRIVVVSDEEENLEPGRQVVVKVMEGPVSGRTLMVERESLRPI